MKSYFALLILLTSALFSNAQNTPIKGDNLVLVSSSLSATDAFRSVMKALAMGGVAVEKSDSGFFTVETKWVPVGKTGLAIRYYIFVEDMEGRAVIRIRGEFETPGLGTDSVQCRGMKGSPSMRSWEAMLGFAEGLNLGPLSFAKV